MSYIDTSVIVAAIDPTDDRRSEARAFLGRACHKYVSELVIVELASALSRRKHLLKDLAQKGIARNEIVIISLIYYLLRKFGLKYKPLSPRARLTVFGKVYVPFAEAIELSTKLNLKTLDLLHVAYAKALKDAGEEIRTLITADRDFWELKDEIMEETGIEVELI
ncbi:MAG: PIN domain-containing protein [Desulfurococcales archaeon]|nr:PIN domain-containing protein [Desulfurococcales archaeon]